MTANNYLSLFYFSRAIQPQIAMAMIVQERLEDIQHLGHLREDEHAVLTRLQATQQNVQGLQLAAVVLDETRLGELHRHARGDFV